MGARWASIVKAIGVVAGVFVLKHSLYASQEPIRTGKGHLDAEYVIAGSRIRLSDGVSEIDRVPGSTTRTVTRYFGNELMHDLDGDGREDVVFILTQETGGSGVFYYVVGALDRPGGYIGSHGLFLGDRIAPQTMEARPRNMIIVNYADRAPGQSFTVPPSIGKSMWLRFDAETLQFGEVVQNFEGEADPDRMTLGMKRWTWIKVMYDDGREEWPRQEAAFTLDLRDPGRFSATTDCNPLSGSYTAQDGRISFGEMASTRMHCEGSQEGEYVRLLTDVTGYAFTSRGELILTLRSGGTTMTFR